MARKKKEKQATEQIQYSGDVVLKLVKDKRILKTIKSKNTATNRLIQGIAMCISKLNMHNINLYQPNFMGVGSDGTPNSSLNMATETALLSQLNNRVDITSDSFKVDYDNNRVVCVLTGLFTYSMVGSSTIREIGLFATESTASLLSRVTINPIQLSPGMSLIIEWKISIENKVV